MLSVLSGLVVTSFGLTGLYYIMDNIMERQEKLSWDIARYMATGIEQPRTKGRLVRVK